MSHESDLVSLDPNASTEDATFSILSNVYEALVTFDGHMAVVPCLAVRWSSPDDRTWQVHLRTGVRFHDGSPFTALDVQRSFERARSRADSDVRAYLQPIQEMEAVGPHELRLRTRRREPTLMSRLAYVLVGREIRRPDGLPGFVGTGPYRALFWSKGGPLETEAFREHWSGAPPIARVIFLPPRPAEESVASMQRGEVDLLREIPVHLVNRLSGLPGVRILSHTGLSAYYLWIDSRTQPGARPPPLGQKAVRQAISYALDRQALLLGLGEYGTPLPHLVPRAVVGHAPQLPAPDGSLPEARRLLETAGYENGFDLELNYRTGVPVLGIVAERIRAMLGRAGIRVTTRALDQESLIGRWQEGRLPFFLAGWRFETADAYAFLVDAVLTREPARSRGGYNPGYSNPVLDRLIEEHGEVPAGPMRVSHYEHVMRLATQELPVIPLYTAASPYAVSRRLVFQPRIDGRLLAAEMSLR